MSRSFRQDYDDYVKVVIVDIRTYWTENGTIFKYILY